MNFYTEVKEGLFIAWDAIRANKLRSILTTLGIVIGVVTVTLMGTAIDGLNRAFLRSISMLGADVLYVSRTSWFIDSYEEWLKVRDRHDITLAQVRELEKQVTLARALGNNIKVGQQDFEVVGVLEKQGNFLGHFNLDNQVIIPVKQFLSGIWHDPDFEIQVKVADLKSLEDAKEELRGVMRKIRHVPPGKEDDFAINQQENFISTFNRVAGTIATAGLFITGLSLFVGGIGIMNIMFVSVAERTREIGVRKAIGAKRRTILVQFLIEAASICLLGGLLALAIAWPMTFLIGQFLPATLSLTVAGIALLVSILTGIVSGFFPAWRAARMNPVD